jgi:hypothetical protein
MLFSLRLLTFSFLVCLVLFLPLSHCLAGVAILANNTNAAVRFSVIGMDGKQLQYMLDRTDVIPIPVIDKVGIIFESQGKPLRYLLQPNTIQYFVETEKSLDLRTYLLPAAPDEDAKLPPPKARNIDHKIYTIAVKILVDDNQPALQSIWEKELRERITEASDIFEHHCGVRFEVKAVETWISDNNISDFQKSLQEFETVVNPAPAQIAIGFTSQYAIPHGLTHLGGTRGPLYPYVLVREWSQHVTRSERLEILVHELGHLLGASHTSDLDSVMRPQLGDRRSHSTRFRIGFDPLNTLAMNLLADELRAGAYHGFAQMPFDTKRELQRIYLALEKEVPKDPAAAQYIEMLNMPRFVAKPSLAKPSELVSATQAVVLAVVDAARVNHKAFTDLKGDNLTEYLIRIAAAEAAHYPPALASKAFMLGIAIAFDDSKLLRDSPVLGSFIREVESDEARQHRLAVLGTPTIYGRHDHAQHFTVSSALVISLCPSMAEKTGIAKEISDSRDKSGFSFIDLSADMAGIAFASQIINGKITLPQLAKSFKIRDYVPEFNELKEGISWEDFTKEYGSINDARCVKIRLEIQKRIQLLPGYKKNNSGENNDH